MYKRFVIEVFNMRSTVFNVVRKYGLSTAGFSMASLLIVFGELPLACFAIFPSLLLITGSGLAIATRGQKKKLREVGKPNSKFKDLEKEGSDEIKALIAQLKDFHGTQNT